MLNSLINDGTGRKFKAEVTDKHALKVAVTEYEIFDPSIKLFQHPLYGVDLNKNFSNEGSGNANETIHNGTDTAEWTGSAILGTWDFASTNNPDTGAKNIETIFSTVADTAEIVRSSVVTMVNHTGFSGRIYITTTGHLLGELNFYAWDTATDTIVGIPVNIYDYINPLSLGVYQSFNIPLVDMGLIGATFDSIRFTTAVKSGATFDLDNIVLNDPTGGSAIGTTTFEIVPDLGRTLFIDGFLVNMAAPYDGKVADGTMPNIPYNTFLNVPVLSSPMIINIYDHLNVVFTASFAQTIDFMQFGNPEVRFAGSDGVNSWFTIYFSLSSPIILFDNLKQRITLTISDDLSPLSFFRWNANCRRTGSLFTPGDTT